MGHISFSSQPSRSPGLLESRMLAALEGEGNQLLWMKQHLHRGCGPRWEKEQPQPKAPLHNPLLNWLRLVELQTETPEANPKRLHFSLQGFPALSIISCSLSLPSACTHTSFGGPLPWHWPPLLPEVEHLRKPRGWHLIHNIWTQGRREAGTRAFHLLCLKSQHCGWKRKWPASELHPSWSVAR